MKYHDLYLEKYKRGLIPVQDIDFTRFSPVVRAMVERDMADAMKAAFDRAVFEKIHGEGPWPKEIPVGILGSGA